MPYDLSKFIKPMDSVKKNGAKKEKNFVVCPLGLPLTNVWSGELSISQGCQASVLFVTSMDKSTQRYDK